MGLFKPIVGRRTDRHVTSGLGLAVLPGKAAITGRIASCAPGVGGSRDGGVVVVDMISRVVFEEVGVGLVQALLVGIQASSQISWILTLKTLIEFVVIIFNNLSSLRNICSLSLDRSKLPT